LEIIPYRENYRDKWEKFVETSTNGTIFHKRRFLSYHPPDRFIDESIIFSEKEWIALFPAVEWKGFLFSHRGASYGGFVFKDNLSIKRSFDLVEKLLKFAKAKGFRGVEMTISPLIYYERPINYIDFVLFKNGFRYTKRELTAYIPVVEEPFSLFKSEARTATRKAKKMGVEVMESDDFQTFYSILKKNLKMRHNVKPTHTVQELFKLKELFPEEIRLFASFLKGKMIAGTVLFRANKRVSLAFYISHNEEYNKYRPVNILFYEVLKWCWQNGYSFLDLGTFTLNMEPNMGLGRFKESIGARGLFRDTLYIEF